MTTVYIVKAETYDYQDGITNSCVFFSKEKADKLVEKLACLCTKLSEQKDIHNKASSEYERDNPFKEPIPYEPRRASGLSKEQVAASKEEWRKGCRALNVKAEAWFNARKEFADKKMKESGITLSDEELALETKYDISADFFFTVDSLEVQD